MTQRRLAFVLALAVVGGARALVAAASPLDSPPDSPPARASIVLHEPSLDEDLDVVDLYAIALNLGQLARADSLLDEGGWDGATRHWLRARHAARERDFERALRELHKAERAWPDNSVLAADFDRDRLRIALVAGSLSDADRVWKKPYADHRGDARWLASRGQHLALAGDLSNAALRFDQAWDRAGSLWRRDPVFTGRALVHLAGGDPAAAAETWLDYALRLRSADEKRFALEVWDEHPELADAIGVAGLRDQAARWLARSARRNEALEFALQAWREGGTRESARGFALAAEQYYRLRRHGELAQLLDQPWPRGLSPEERAELESYPWGVKRRSGASEDVARGFDGLVEAYPRTDRAVEALWEAAWMWELVGDLEIAEARFWTYATEHSGAPFARGSAERAVYLPFVKGHHEETLQRLNSLRRPLRDGKEEASTLWLASRSARALGDEQRAIELEEELARRHPDSPYVQNPPTPLPQPRVRDGEGRAALMRELFARQRQAFEDVGAVIGVVDPFTPEDPRLVRIDQLLRLGMYWEGERAIIDVASEESQDGAVQLYCTALAWKHGRPERQARTAWRIRALLRGRDQSLDLALDRIYHPTPYANAVLTAADQLRLPAGLVWGVIRRESFYEADVISLAEANGLMQLLESTAGRMAAKLGDPRPGREQLLEPLLNVRYGTAYLEQLLEESAGNPYQALAAYNAGERNGERWRDRLPDGAPMQEMLLVISYSETRGYVYNVLRFWELYGRIYPSLGQRDGLIHP